MIEIYRHKGKIRKLRHRVYALQYTGQNAEDIQEFLGNKVFVNSETNVLVCSGSVIHPSDWVIRKIIELGEFKKKMEESFQVMSDYWFNETYKRTGKCH